MALLFVDSFGHYATADILKKYNDGSFSNGMAIQTTGGRRGGPCIKGPAGLYKNFDAEKTTLIMGFAYRCGGVGNFDVTLCSYLRGSSARVTLHANSAGELYVRNDEGNVIGRTRPNLIFPGATAYIEFKVVAGLVGAAEVRVNGNTELQLINVRTSEELFISFGLGKGGFYDQIDTQAIVNDLYVCDTAGSFNNDFLGDCRVDAYLPTSEGAVQEWVPFPEGVHYTTVDDVPINENDYLETATSGAIEVLGYTDLVNIPLAVYGVQLNTAIKKIDAGERQFKSVAYVGGTPYDAGEKSIGDSIRLEHHVWDANPATGTAWTRESVNLAQFGVKLI